VLRTHVVKSNRPIRETKHEKATWPAGTGSTARYSADDHRPNFVASVIESLLAAGLQVIICTHDLIVHHLNPTTCLMWRWQITTSQVPGAWPRLSLVSAIRVVHRVV
jgi:hypothetical protein